MSDVDMWKTRSDRMMQRMLDVLFRDDRPAALAGFDMKQVETDSLILYLSLIHIFQNTRILPTPDSFYRINNVIKTE